MRHSISRLVAALCLLGIGAAHATNGISVTGHWSGSSYGTIDYHISRFDLENDYVVKITRLFTSGSGKGACKPRMNLAGTHVAFNRHDIAANKWYLCVMDVDKGEAGTIHTLTETDRVDCAWPTDQWIYYSKGSQLWKINPANKTQNEKVGDFPYTSTKALRMSADGSRMHNLDNADDRHYLQRQSNGTYASVGQGGGCSPGLSPSGTMTVWFVDAGHIAHIMNTWKGPESSQFYVLDDTLNVWGMKTWPSTDKVITCTYYGRTAPRPMGFGGNTDGHGWSNNSDKWTLIQMGTDSRFLDCGSNQIAFNYIDKKAINFTKGWRACKEAKEDTICDLSNADIPGGTADKHAETGDFWVSSLEDVNADLRCYVAQREQWRTYWNTVLAGGQATQPGCTSVGAGDRAVPMRRTGATITGIGDLLAKAGTYDRISIADAQGRVVFAGPATSRASVQVLKRGWYCATLLKGATVRTTAVVVAQ